MEEKLAKQILAGMADSRLNPSHLAWLVKLHSTRQIDDMLKEFFYYYTTFRNQDTEDNDARWMGEKLLEQLRHPDHEGLSNPPPPGTRIVYAD